MYHLKYCSKSKIAVCLGAWMCKFMAGFMGECMGEFIDEFMGETMGG